MRPARQVEPHPIGYAVTGERFVTTDPTLAAAVAAELDRIDPLPCDHVDAGLIQIHAADRAGPIRTVWSCCGEENREIRIGPVRAVAWPPVTIGVS